MRCNRLTSEIASEYVDACQMETVLSLRERKRDHRVSIVYSKADLDRYKPGRDDNGDPGYESAKYILYFFKLCIASQCRRWVL